MNYTFNEKQFLAIEAQDPNVVIIAPAGSGKTSTLIGAIKRYKDENPQASVVAITFTRKSAEDLRLRLGGYRGVTASTIHSWSYQELQNLSQRLGKENPENAFKIKLLEDDKIKEILKDICQKRKYYYIKDYELFIYVMGNYNIDIEDSTRRIYDSVRNEYIAFKKNNGLYDFTDLPEYLLDKLTDYDEDINHIDALFVDEFQDVDDVQLEVFSKVKAGKKFYIGDPSQSIYMFRGATPDVINKLNGFSSMGLDMNYRSYQEIIDFATTAQQLAQADGILFSSIMESYPSPIRCEKGYGGEVFILNRTGAAYEVNKFMKLKGEDVVRKFLLKGPMILCRKNKEVRAIKELGYDRVTTIHQAKGLEYPSVIITDFDVDSEEDINIAYVGMTRAENRLLAANYTAFMKILRKMKADNTLVKSLF
jgi:DNA helicase II / ATP-dependent DNA helicase PcrA